MAKEEFDYEASLEHADELAEKIDFEEEDCGDWTFAIDDVKMATTRKGHPMLKLRGECVDSPHEDKRGFINIVWPLYPGAGMSADQWRTLCRVTGYKPSGKITEIPEEELQAAFLGQTVVFSVSIEESEEYGRQNRFNIAKGQI